MKVARCHLVSSSPYSPGKQIMETKSRDETHDAFEERTWRQRCHTDGKGNVIIPPMCFKNALAVAAKYKSIQIPGKGKATYTKHFEAGVLCSEPIRLDVKVDEVQGERLSVPADGVRGSGKRVSKCFPYIPSWSGVVEFMIFDDLIDEGVFTAHLEDAGRFIGVGRFRPRNNGYYGRFTVEKVEWQQ
jgi:hypothetical protein